MRFKPGDRVRIKSLDWYNKNKDYHGDVDCGTQTFIESMALCCGEVLTIKEIINGSYFMEGEAYWWNDEMIEGLAEEDKGLDKLMDLIEYHGLKHEVNLPDGYEFQDENDNVINTKKITLVKKKPKYPTTYEECCRIMGIEYLYIKKNENTYSASNYRNNLVCDFVYLLICRDAYWKIAGEEMGLGKSWEPEYKSLIDNHFYVIYTFNGVVKKSGTSHRGAILAFPTEEMRDAFYENFKELIESCKELL